jgi:pyruvate dehydrogenase E1 component subunit alpha
MQEEGTSIETSGIGFSPDEELSAYRTMLTIRRFEEKAGQLYALGAIRGRCPLTIGQEAVITGMIMAAAPGDQVITGARNNGQMLALGIPPERILAELMGRSIGLSGGRGGSMHMFATEHGFYGAHTVPGTSPAYGAGIALANRYKGRTSVCLSFFGDVAATKGRVGEAFQIATLWSLPVVFVIDNAVPPEAAPPVVQNASERSDRPAPASIPRQSVDGIDVREARLAGRAALARARAGGGPTILDMQTFRYRGHDTNRTGTLERRREDTDPVYRARARILHHAVATERDLKGIEREVRDRIAAAAATAKASEPAAESATP